MKISLHKNPLAKFGLVVGIILGIAIVSQVSEALDHVTVRSLGQSQHEATVIRAVGNYENH